MTNDDEWCRKISEARVDEAITKAVASAYKAEAEHAIKAAADSFVSGRDDVAAELRDFAREMTARQTNATKCARDAAEKRRDLEHEWFMELHPSTRSPA